MPEINTMCNNEFTDLKEVVYWMVILDILLSIYHEKRLK